MRHVRRHGEPAQDQQKGESFGSYGVAPPNEQRAQKSLENKSAESSTPPPPEQKAASAARVRSSCALGGYVDIGVEPVQ